MNNSKQEMYTFRRRQLSHDSFAVSEVPVGGLSSGSGCGDSEEGCEGSWTEVSGEYVDSIIISDS